MPGCRALPAKALNLSQTGHPFHHLTANGAIVESDPTLEYCLGRLTEEASAAVRKRYGDLISANVKPAIACNRTYYGHDPYA